jgi:hypothetical protein
MDDPGQLGTAAVAFDADAVPAIVNQGQILPLYFSHGRHKVTSELNALKIPSSFHTPLAGTAAIVLSQLFLAALVGEQSRMHQRIMVARLQVKRLVKAFFRFANIALSLTDHSQQTVDICPRGMAPQQLKAVRFRFIEAAEVRILTGLVKLGARIVHN